MAFLTALRSPALPLSEGGLAKDEAVTARGGDFAIAVLDRAEAVHAIAGEWTALFARCGRPGQVFQSYAWNAVWMRHYAGSQNCNCTPLVITQRRNGRLVGLWPLVLVRRYGLKIVKWMGEPVSQYGDVLIDGGENRLAVLEAGWQALRALRADAINLRKVRADAQIMPLFDRLGLRPFHAERAPYLDLASASDFTAYETRYSSKARKNRRRLARRLAGLGAVSLEHLSGTAAARSAAVEAITLKQRSLAASGRPCPSLGDPRFAAFFGDAVAATGAEATGTQVSCIRVDGQLVAAAIDITAHGHRAAHLIVHDPRFDACGPGQLMVEAWVRSTAEAGIGTFDFLAPAHAYKREWADGEVAVADFGIGLSPLGIAYAEVYLRALRHRLKAGVERVAHWRAGTGTARACGAKPAANDASADVS